MQKKQSAPATTFDHAKALEKNDAASLIYNENISNGESLLMSPTGFADFFI